MDSACPKEHVTEILSDSDHSTKVAPTTLTRYWDKYATKKHVAAIRAYALQTVLNVILFFQE